MQIRTKPRVRIGGRDEKDRPIWHAVRAGTIATGTTPHQAHHNLHHVAPGRAKQR
jgi:hypothetical protein